MGQRKNAENKLKTRKKHSKNTKTGQKSTEKCLLQEFFDAQKALCSKRFRDFGGMLKSLGKSRKNLGSLVQMQQKTRSKPIVSNVFFVKIGGEEGIRSRLRARSGCVLTPHRGVIHFAPVRIPSNANAKRTPFGVLRWRRGRDSNPCALSRKLISSR